MNIKQQQVKAYRCRSGHCKKISTARMIKYYGRCYNCHFREFTGCGKINLIEEVVTLIRDYFIGRKKSNEKIIKKRVD